MFRDGPCIVAIECVGVRLNGLSDRQFVRRRFIRQ